MPRPPTFRSSLRRSWTGCAWWRSRFWGAAGQVWVVERTGAAVQFLVFGNDRSIPLQWLKRYGHLAPDVAFYFLTDSGQLEDLR